METQSTAKELLDAVQADIAAQTYANGMCGSCRHVHAGSCRIPYAPVYVLSNDSFMSGWGLSRGQINVCVVPCADSDELDKVLAYVEKRTDQKYIRTAMRKPQARGRKLSLLLAWRDNALGR